MKIVSLLPSATEIVFALGPRRCARGGHPRVRFPAHGTGQAGRVRHRTARTGPDRRRDRRIVSSSVQSGQPIYTLDAEAIRGDRTRPDPDAGPVRGVRGAGGCGRGGARDARLPRRGYHARPDERRRRDRRDRYGRCGDRHEPACVEPDGRLRARVDGSALRSPVACGPARSRSNGPIPRSVAATGFPR